MEVSPCHNVMCFEWHPNVGEAMKAADAAGWLPAPIAGGLTPAAGPVVQTDVRSCHVSRGIPPDLLKDLEAAVTGIGHYAYGFAVNGLQDSDPSFVMRYQTGDHFAWHVDNGVRTPPLGSRKLSFTLQLSDPADYDGGDLEFAVYSQAYNEGAAGPSPVLRQLGNLIVFPSFMLHRVSPVTRGVRYAIVGWIHGPAFT